MIVRRATTLLLAVAAAVAILPLSAEVIEEIVAKVNDDIITKSEYEAEEQQMIAEMYRRYTGAELDAQVTLGKQVLLQNMIDRKLLLHRAERLYDMDTMKKVMLESFMEQQGITSRSELETLLAQENMTVEDIERRLVEMAAPDQVIGFEVTDRVAIGDREIDEYYEEHPDEFLVPGEVRMREIVLLARTDFQKDARRADAEALAKRLEQGTDEEFARTATEVSESASAEDGGLVGPFTRKDLLKPIAEQAFSIPVGSVSGVIESEHGFHIIRVESRTESEVLELEPMREELRERIRTERVAEQLQVFIARARTEADIWINPRYDPDGSTRKLVSARDNETPQN